MTPASENPDAWAGPHPLANPLSVERLGEIYSGTAAFYDGIVAAKQAAAKLEAIALLARRPHERLIEIGAGTGWALQRVIEASGAAAVYALDIAPGMLDVARDRLGLPAEGLALLLADGRALPFAAASIDCLLNTYTFEVMAEPDILRMLGEMRRVLRPDGRAVIVNLTDATDGGSEAEAMIGDWKQRYALDPEAFGGARPLQLAPLLEAQGFHVITRVYVGPAWPSEVLLARLA